MSTTTKFAFDLLDNASGYAESLMWDIGRLTRTAPANLDLWYRSDEASKIIETPGVKDILDRGIAAMTAKHLEITTEVVMLLKCRTATAPAPAPAVDGN